MSTPTPIEIVRAHVQWRIKATEGFDQIPTLLKELTDALASVLADAERYKALELALTNDKIFVSTPDPHDDDLWAPHDGTLAELADRLRKEL